MTDHEQPAARVALKPCPGFNPDLSSRGEGDCLNCGRHQSEHTAPTDAGGAVSEGAVPYGWIYEEFKPGVDWCAPCEWWPAQFTRTPPKAENSRNVITLYASPQPLQQGGEVTRAVEVIVSEAIFEHRDNPTMCAGDVSERATKRILALFATLAADRDKAVGLLRRWREPDGQWSASIDTDAFLSSQTGGS